MRVFVSAAEISSDLHAEKILREILSLYSNQKIEIFGIGGPRVRSIPGFRTIEQAENLRVMGFVEVLAKISKIKSIRDKVLKALEETPPDLVLTLDYPDFHFSLMRAWSESAHFKKALKICGIPPKVWVWRSKRVEKIRALYDGVWVIFPFEKIFYERHRIPVIYEGNPLIADWVENSTTSKKPTSMAMDEKNIRLAVMPGSRISELKYHLPMIPRTLDRLARLSGRQVTAQVPIPSGVESDFIQRALISTPLVKFEFFSNGTLEVLQKNTIGLIKSGTSTLEAAVLGCVPIIFYKVHPISEWIFRIFVRYKGPVGLPNILLGIKRRTLAVYPELIGVEATSDVLAVELWRTLQDPADFEKKKALGLSLRDQLVPHQNVSQAIARKMLAWKEKRPITLTPRQEKVSIKMLSFLWSSVNAFRRKCRDWGFIDSRNLPLPSILVGNLQAGGTGKTPVVIELAKEAIRRGLRVGIISRGYRAEYSEDCLLADLSMGIKKIGDEPFEILSTVPGVHLALSSDRILAAQALKNVGVQILILDDGFQNLKFKADVNLLLVTDADPAQMVYRDFVSAQTEATFMLQTKGPINPAFEGARRIEWSPLDLPKSPIWLLCGVGDPVEVEEFYRSHGVEIKKVVRLDDHEAVSTNSVKKLVVNAGLDQAKLAMTEKDWIKIKSPDLSEVFVLKRKVNNHEWLNPIFERLQGR